MQRRIRQLAQVVLFGCAPISSAAQELDAPRYVLNTFGMPGIVEMPSAAAPPDGQLGITFSNTRGTQRTAMVFQIAPRLTGAFRYSRIQNLDQIQSDNALYDRSFDLQYRLVDEGRYRPAIAIGLRDIVGTGIYSSEYVVATKTFTPKLRASVGLGWGRLAGRDSFTNPLGILSSSFETRPVTGSTLGGTFSTDHWFRGPVSAFAGVEYHPSDRLSFAIEYSPDIYAAEVAAGTVTQKSGVNVGVNYKLSDALTFGAQYLYGTEASFSLSYAFNPKVGAAGSGRDAAPIPVAIRPTRASNPQSWGEEWVTDPQSQPVLRQNIESLFAQEGLRVITYNAQAQRIEVRFENTRYSQQAQALGRAARALSAALPNSIETFVLVPVQNGMATTSTTLQRADLERLAYSPNGSADLRDAMRIEDAGTLDARAPLDGLYPRFRWRVSPYVQGQLFDPRNPILADFGVSLKASYQPAPNFIISGEVRQRVIGNLDKSRLVNPYPAGAPAPVRTDGYQYNQHSDLTIRRLTAEYFFRPGRNLYGRVSGGYLERMYGGVSAEVLWKAPGNRLSLGIEGNYVRKRAFDQQFDFLDYDVLTGHASAYYQFNRDFHGQLDVGRYLAGDWGATFALDREFGNGWTVGAFATLTDVSAAEFGEGSFDKGIRITIPLDWGTGRPSRQVFKNTIKPLQRDGGARLKVDNRLYDVVRGYSDPDLSQSWGRVLR